MSTYYNRDGSVTVTFTITENPCTEPDKNARYLSEEERQAILRELHGDPRTPDVPDP